MLKKNIIIDIRIKYEKKKSIIKQGNIEFYS